MLALGFAASLEPYWYVIFSSVILHVRSLLVSVGTRFGPCFGRVNLVYVAHCPISGGDC